jgi:uncharacterized membrane protein YebE (DUF533 family)
MSDFDKLCKEFESLDPVTFTDILREKSVKIIAALSAISKDGFTGVQIYTSFIVAAIMADGKLDKSEFNLIRPALEAMVGSEVTYEEAKEAFKAIKKNAKDDRFIVDLMVDMLGQLSQELKDDIIIVTMLVCAVDGKISMKEKKWIKQLIV